MRGCADARKKNPLAGSSVGTPWILDDHGGLTLPPPAPKKVIYKGPPSTIRQLTLRNHGRGAAAARLTVTDGRITARPEQAFSEHSQDARAGWREPRAVPLSYQDLYLGATRPPILAVPKPHHVCSICRDIKSHPVSYMCGHSHCYVCIRPHLEHHWTCPICNAKMHFPPFRHEGEEQGIKFDYSWWRDDNDVLTSIPLFDLLRTDRHSDEVMRAYGRQSRTAGGRLDSALKQTQKWVQDVGPLLKLGGKSILGGGLGDQPCREADSFSYALGNESLEAQPEDQLDDGINVVICHPVRNLNSDRPLQTWYPYNDEYLGENLRRKGRGSERTYSRCAGIRGSARTHCANPECKDKNAEAEQARQCHGAPEWRCVDQACVGERWNGRRFVRKRNGLKKLGLRVQLNHPPGVVCPYRKAAATDFVLYDLNGVHELNVDFCGCLQPNGGPALERRTQSWNCLGKLSAYDFLRGLERCTNNDGLSKPPDRRKPFMHIVRQWREVKRMKRGKQGHKKGGTKATKRGELALRCRACPDPEWNLEEDWQNIDPAYRLRTRYLATDWGTSAPARGADGYKAHIGKHVNEKEISNCSGFQAMFMANTKRVKGLCTTGIGGVTCARHNMWRANGMGDLQVGERYCNMDFLLLAALMGFQILYLILSYNIACQYAINFWQRVAQMPRSMQPQLAPENVWWKVPNFHLPPPKGPCHFPVFLPLDVGCGYVARGGCGAELVILQRSGWFDEAYGSGIASHHVGGHFRFS
ncbi:hypothetical protein B0H14DRAFT_2630156 [Mycena olivaceomarginata]|nr:hypothetical protein B0H14DRAFT_2630156 [Mycena olivaceomarginata]